MSRREKWYPSGSVQDNRCPLNRDSEKKIGDGGKLLRTRANERGRKTGDAGRKVFFLLTSIRLIHYRREQTREGRKYS